MMIYTHVLRNMTNRPNISKSMQWLGVTYTRRFNIKHRRIGHLFQGRFKLFLIENDKYLLILSSYIHRNPLLTGIVRRLIDYQWSTYKIYAYGKPSPEWLRTDVLLSQIHGKDKNRGYNKIVQDYSKEKKRISGLDKDKRDKMILLLNTSLYRNYEIAKIFNISYPSVSKQVSNIRLNLRR